MSFSSQALFDETRGKYQNLKCFAETRGQLQQNKTDTAHKSQEN
jgi:hypothetical protein